MGLFNRQKKISNTGVFIVDGRSLRPLDEMPKENSINSISESLGYFTDQVHVVPTFESSIIEFIGFKRRTKQPIFVGTKDKDTPLSYPDVSDEIEQIDWAFQNRQFDFEDNL